MLYVVSTPIGNLADITYRAVETLREVNLILAEDTRRARILLDHYDIRTPVSALHEHNEARSIPRLLERWQQGERIAIISDAGTPLISDPGARIVEAAIAAEVAVVALPGASAVLTALVVAGIPAEPFTFFGFLPRSGGERRRLVTQITSLQHAAVLYESPARVAKTLQELSTAGAGDRRAIVGRELTKKFEEVRRGTIDELEAYYQGLPQAPKGEIVVVIEGGGVIRPDEQAIRQHIASCRAAGQSVRETIAYLVEQAHVPRNLAYRLAHETAEPADELEQG